MDVKALAGKPLVAVLDEIWLGITPNRAGLADPITVGDGQSIVWDEYSRFGDVNILYSPPRPQRDEDHRKGFAAAAKPIFLALADGTLLQKGFRPDDESDFAATIARRKWCGGWQISIGTGGRGGTVVFQDARGNRVVYDLEALELGVGIARTVEPGANAAVSALRHVPEEKIGQSKYLSYIGDVDAIMNREHPPSLTAACEEVLKRTAGKGDNVKNMARRLRDVYKKNNQALKPQIRAPGKVRKNAEIP